MFKVVRIGEKDVEMLANAASPYRYKRIFREDFIKAAFENNGKPAESLDLFTKMGYVMAMQAAKADLDKLNEDTFLEWLEGFDAKELQDAIGDIAGVYMPNTETESSPKRKADRPKGK